MDTFFRKYFPHDDDGTRGFHQELGARLPEHGTVLDLGCGDNRPLARYRTPERRVWGTDFTVHPRLHDAEWFRPLQADGGIPFPAESFDTISALWVLEHIDEPVVFLREVGRVLRPGGQFVALTIDSRHYVTWMTRLLHGLPHAITQAVVRRLYGRLADDTHPTFFRLNTPNEVRRAAPRAGLRLTNVRRFANPDYFSFWQRLRRAAIVTDWTLETLFPGRGRLYFVVTLRKPTVAEVTGTRLAA